MIILEDIQVRIALFLLILWILYSFWYVVSKKQFGSLFNLIKDTFIETYKYSLNLLTLMFLIIFYTEIIVGVFIQKGFSVASIIERNPNNTFEFIMVFPTTILMVGSMIWWTNKIMKLVGNNFLRIQYDNQAVAVTMRLMSFVVFIFFHGLILLPMFTYGIVGAFGNPRV